MNKFILGLMLIIVGFIVPNDPPFVFFIGLALCCAGGWFIGTFLGERK